MYWGYRIKQTKITCLHGIYILKGEKENFIRKIYDVERMINPL